MPPLDWVDTLVPHVRFFFVSCRSFFTRADGRHRVGLRFRVALGRVGLVFTVGRRRVEHRVALGRAGFFFAIQRCGLVFFFFRIVRFGLGVGRRVVLDLLGQGHHCPERGRMAA